MQKLYPSLVTDDQKDYLIPGKVQIVHDTAIYTKMKTLEIKEFENEDRCLLCNNKYEKGKCSKKHMYCVIKKQYTKHRNESYVYDSFYDKPVLISEKQCKDSFLIVEIARARIRGFKISTAYQDREKKINTLRDHIERIMKYYPEMLTDTQQLFYEDAGKTLYNKDIKYEMTMSLNDLLVLNPIK